MRQGSHVLYTNNLSCAEQEIKSLGGRITHQFSESIIIANFPNFVNQELKNSFITPSTCLQRKFSEVEKRLVQAWELNEEESRGPYHAPLAINSWDAFGFAPPCNENVSVNLTPSGKGIIPADTSRYMIGKIAIGLVIVSGDFPNCKISEIEEDKVLREVIKGTDFLANVEPRARITFRYYIYFPEIKTKPNVTGASNEKHEDLESLWRDAALEELGYSSGDKGINELINEMKENSSWAYVAFFTKYPVSYFAYARHQHLVMHYNNGLWGPDYINRIFAHETCHIFGAMDEYDMHGCDPSGILQIINGNAQNCSQIKDGIRCKKDCLMNSSTLVLCEFSRGQLGWPWDLSSDLKKQVRISLRNSLSNSKCTIRDKRIAAWVSLVICDYGHSVEIYEMILKDPDCTPEDRQKAAEIKELRWSLEIRKILQKIKRKFSLLSFLFFLFLFL